VPQPSGPTDIVADEAVHKELGDSLVRVATTASSLEARHDSVFLCDHCRDTELTQEVIGVFWSDSLEMPQRGGREIGGGVADFEERANRAEDRGVTLRV
ncbi:hypothetical protein Tco_1063084, partial [Tanacetum coccineum]